MGPCIRTQLRVMAATISGPVLFGKMLAAIHLMASSSRWLIMRFRWNKMSHCTISLKEVASRSEEVMVRAPGLVHSLHVRHVSTISMTSLTASAGAPARRKSSASLLALACQKRTWSRRSVRRTMAASGECSIFSALPQLNAIQPWS